MSLKNFRSYNLAVELYRACQTIKVPAYVKDQLMRAASSVALNLREGSAKPGPKDRRRFYLIAFASLREVQAITDLEQERCAKLVAEADVLAAHLYRLTRALGPCGRGPLA